MDYKSLKTLEYHKIIEKLSSYAGSEAARKMCADLKPMTDINSINDALTQTSDALSRIYAKGSVSFSGVTNIIDSTECCKNTLDFGLFFKFKLTNVII